MSQVIDWTRERCQMENAIDFAFGRQRLTDIMLQKSQPAASFEVSQVLAMTCNQVIESDDLVACLNEPLTQM